MKRIRQILVASMLSMIIISTWGGFTATTAFSADTPPAEKTQGEEPSQEPEEPLADVLSVKVTGKPDAYSFSVEVKSPDEGCEQYADWWEVLTDDGDLLYRRILAHSHVDEQPFVRSGGSIDITADTVVVVRAHMHPGGYGGAALQGSVKAGFEPVELTAGFAAEVEAEPPQPTGCAF